MSKLRDLPENIDPAAEDLLYIVDESVGPNSSRKIKYSTLQTSVLEGIATAAPITVDADGNNDEGIATTFSKSDHKHNVQTAAAATQNPDQINAEGVSSSLARADHIHNIPCDAPTTNLSPATSNSEGIGTSFARNDHTHALEMAQATDLSTINAGDSEELGIIDRLARADHQHPVSTAAASSLSATTTNTEGVATSLARSDHTHAIPSAAPVNTGSANATGSSASFARADHVHNTVLNNNTANGTVDATTVSVTDVLLDNMTLTPIAGTYLVSFSTSTLNSGNGSQRNYFSIYVGGVLQTATDRVIGISGGTFSAVHTHGIVTVDGSQAIEIRWRVIAGTGTCRSRKLTAIRIG